MDYEIIWGGDPEDVCMRTRGVANVGDLDAMVRDGLADARWREGMRILLDHRECDWSQMLLRDIELRAQLMIGQADEIGYQRIAFVVGTAASYGVGRMLGLLLDSEVGFEARAFNAIEEAREWLRQPPDPRAHVLPAS